ncbi:MAG TPA: hypothetical protein VFZ97_13755 [Acidimicrobiales bacterium]
MPGAATTPMMRAAVYRGEHTVVIEKIPVPELEPTKVLLEISHCEICGSDLHMSRSSGSRVHIITSIAARARARESAISVTRVPPALRRDQRRMSGLREVKGSDR